MERKSIENYEEQSTDTEVLSSNFARYLGVFLLIGSGVAFMLQSYNTLSSIERTGSFWLVSLVLTGLGYWSGKKQKDATGARIALSLAGLSTTVLFSQIGAMIYNQFFPHSAVMPSVFQLEANWLVIGIFLGITLLTSLFAHSLAYFSMVRREAWNLSFATLLMQGLLMVPIRSNESLFFLISVWIVGTLVYLFHSRLTDYRKDLPWILGMISSPVFAIIGRGLFYPQNPSMIAMVLILGAVLCGIYAFIRRQTERSFHLSNAMVILTMLAVFFLWFGIDFGKYYYSNYLALPTIMMLIPVALLVRLGLLGSNSHEIEPRSRVFAISAILPWSASFAVYGLQYSAFNFELIAALALVTAIVQQVVKKCSLQVSTNVLAGAAAVGLLGFSKPLMTTFSSAPWLVLAGIGIVVLAYTSYREGQKLKSKR